MRFSTKRICCLFIVFSIVLLCNIPVNAATPVLKNYIENERLYECVSIKNLNIQHKTNKDNLEKNYNDKDVGVVVTGMFMYNSLKSDKEFYLYSEDIQEYIIIDTSDNKGIANSYNANDKVTVYGMLDSIKKDSYKLKAIHIDKNSNKSLSEGAYVYYGKPAVITTTDISLDSDEHIRVKIPENWNNMYVKDKLPNPKVKGNQYYLNALNPQNKEYAEVFYIFYLPFDEFVTGKVSWSSRDELEELIVRNVLTEKDEEEVVFKFKEETINKVGTWLNIAGMEYFNLDWKLEDEKKKISDDYSMEFFFKMDGDYEGLIVMLYLHYPNMEKAQHLHEVATVIKTLEN